MGRSLDLGLKQRHKIMKSTQQTFWIFALAFVTSIVAQTNRGFAQVTTAEAESSTVQPDASQLGSLMRVPDSAGFYISTMNHKAIIESIFESNAYKSIKSSDVARGMKKAYRRGRTRGYDDYNRQNPFAQYLQGYGDSIDNVIFQSVWQVAKQVIDNELFVYVDNDALALVNVIQEAQAKFMSGLSPGGDLDFDNMDDEQKSAMIDFIVQTAEAVECPTVIMGSRLDNPDGFRGMLELARSAAEQGMRNLPPELDMVQEFWKVVEEEDNFLLMAQIDLSKLPWEELLEDAEPEEKEMALRFRDAVAKKQATVAMGIVDNLLVLGLAKDQTKLTEFGNGAKLIDLASLKPLRSAIDQNQKVTSVFYMSQEYAEASYSMERAYQQIQPIIRPLIFSMDDRSDAEKERLITLIETEANQFIKDFSELVPPLAMQFGFTTLQSDGLHGYSRSNAKHPMLDGSKTLTLAKHAGPDTIAFFNSSLHRLTDQYELSSKWASKLYRYGRDFAFKELEKDISDSSFKSAAQEAFKDVSEKLKADKTGDDALADFNRELTGDQNDSTTKQDADTQKSAATKSKLADDLDSNKSDDEKSETDFETIKSFVADVEGMVQRFDQITRTKLLPAIDGQEAGLFVDAVSGPNPWHAEIPVAQTPLPLPLPAMVVGTNDSGAIVEAGEAYWKLADDLLTSAKKHFPEEDVKEAFLLPPNRIEKNGNVSFRWSFLHDFLEVDSSVQPGTLVNDNWIVMNLHLDQAKRLTAPQADQQLFGPADTDQPSIGVMFYDHRVAMKSIRSWIDFAETQIPEGEGPFNLAEQFPAERDTLQFTEPQLRDAFERIWAFAGCMKGVSIRSYHDETGTVTESLMKFEDIKAEK